jgi:hypothetical protein
MALQIIDTYLIPSHYLPALINDDRTNLTDCDEEELDAWLNNEFEGQYHGLVFATEEDQAVSCTVFFSDQPAFGAPCDVHETTVWGHEGSGEEVDNTTREHYEHVHNFHADNDTSDLY